MEIYKAGPLASARELLEICMARNVAYTFDDLLLEPQYSEILSRQDVNTETYFTPFRKISTPMVAANMDSVCEDDMALAMHDLGTLGIVHRYMDPEKQVDLVNALANENQVVCVSVGTLYVEDQVQKLVDAGASIIAIDVAHGHHKLVGDMLRKLKEKNYISLVDQLPVEYIAGDVAIPQAVQYLVECGADAIRVGVGPGSLCTTRVVTGHGVPQLTAIAACSLKAAQYNKTIIADGGIRSSGDIVKALAAGANSVICGSLFAGTDEAPGEIFTANDGKRYKIYRGMASYEAQVEFYNEPPDAPEGVSTTVPYKGSVKSIVKALTGGVRSGLSYSGCVDIPSFKEAASWVRVTNSGNRESVAHLLLPS